MSENGIAGQVSIFDYIGANNSISLPTDDQEPKPQLMSGQEVYIVKRGDVVKYTVMDNKPWKCGKVLGYQLQVEVGHYGTVRDDELGIIAFTDYNTAHKVAEAYLNSHKVIRAEDIKAENTIGYTYVRKCDSRNMVSFMAEIGNELLYIKGFMTFGHIVKDTKVERKKFNEELNLEYPKTELIDYVPTFKNMYKCRKDCDWLYTEAGCSHCE